MIQLNKFRICVCYLITTFLISGFVYSLISNNIQSMKKLERLREDVDEIAHLVLQTSATSGRESHHLSDMVDNMIKKRLTGIWDDLYALRKMLKGANECTAGGINDSKVHNEQQSVVKIEERVNYASYELGAKIMNLNAKPLCAPNFLKSWMGMEFSANPPIRILKSSMEPGNCFAYKEEKAEVTIKLAHEIFIDQIVVEHIKRNQSPTEDTSSAPKDFQVIGIRGDLEEYFLGTYRFHNKPGKSLQYFPIVTNYRMEYLRFKFESNHGNPNYTCIYRIAVYGKL